MEWQDAAGRACTPCPLRGGQSSTITASRMTAAALPPNLEENTVMPAKLYSSGASFISRCIVRRASASLARRSPAPSRSRDGCPGRERRLEWRVAVTAKFVAVGAGPSRRAADAVRRPRPGRQDAHAGADPPAAAGPDRHPWRPHAQPEEHRRHAPATAVHRRDRRERLGEVVARLRYGLRRGTAALRRIAVGLRPAVPRADGEAERRPYRRHLPGHRHSPEEQLAEPAVDGGDDNRDLRLPATALRPRRPDHLSPLRRRGGPRDGGGGGPGAERAW